MQWNDNMDEAPRDAHILVAHHYDNHWRGRVVIGYCHSDYNGHKNVVTETGRAGWPINPKPVAWMPLPEPPK